MDILSRIIKKKNCFTRIEYGGKMPFSVYETVNNDKLFPIHVFVASIESSVFHWHKEYEMIGMLKGSMHVRVQSETILLKEGDVFLVNSNEVYALKSVDGEVALCMFIQMEPSLFKTGDHDILFYLDSTGEEQVKCGFDRFYYRMSKIVYESMNEDKHAPFRVRAQASCMIAELFDYVVYDVRFGEGRKQNEQEMVVRFMEYAQMHMAEEHVLDLACHEFGMSRKTLDRSIKTSIGLSAKEIIDDLRMEKAKTLLKTTNKNMNYILDACGFGSEKTFYRLFRQETGLTPKAFRENGSMVSYDSGLKGYLDFETPMVKGMLKGIIDTYQEKNHCLEG